MFYTITPAHLIMSLFIFAALAYLYLAASTLINDVKSTNRRNYAATLFFISASSFFYGLMTVSTTERIARLFWDAGFTSFMLFFPFLLRFIAGMLPSNKRFYGNRVCNLFFAWALFVCFFGIISDGVAFRFTVLGTQFESTGGIGAWVFYVILIFTFSATFIGSVAVYRWWTDAKTKRDRKQLSRFLIMVVLTAPIGFFMDIWIPLISDFTAPPFASVVVFPAFFMFSRSMKKFRTLSITAPDVAQHLFGSVAVPVFELDFNNNITLTNWATLNFLGDDVLGQNFAGLIRVEGKPPPPWFFDNEIYNEEISISTPGGLKYCELSFSVEYDQYDEPLSKVAMLIDISRRVYMDNLRKAIYDASLLLLNSSPATFRELLHKAMGIIGEVVNVDRMYIWQNHNEETGMCCTQLFEWSGGAHPVQGTVSAVCIPYNKIAPNWLNSFLANQSINGIVADMQVEERTHLQEQGIVSVLVMPIFMGSEFWGFIGFDDCAKERIFTKEEEYTLRSVGLLFAEARLRNDTLIELQQTQDELLTALDEAEHASKAKSNFLASVSHEIRTPLNAILGMSQIALQKENLNSEIKGFFGTIYTSGSNLLAIINDLLDSSKIETGKMDLNPNEYDLISMLNDTAALNAALIGERPIEFIIEADPNLPSLLVGDALRLKQVASNFISNAIKYTASGYVKFSVSFTPDGEDIFLKFIIEDTGSGIKSEDIPKLFSEYWRGDNRRSWDGTGLGLTITKKLVELMDGTIDVESEFGKGSKFTVSVKQKVGARKPIGAKTAKALRERSFSATANADDLHISKELMPYGKVLVVDDMQTNLIVAEAVISSYAITVTLAESGFEAIEKVRLGKKYDIIFMDHMMPNMDGIETTAKLREMGYGGPIVALTANAIKGNREMFLENGFDGFISKPIDVLEMDKILTEFVRDRHPEEAIKHKEITKRLGGTNTLTKDLAFEVFRHDVVQALETLKITAVKGKFRRAGDLKQYLTYVHGMKSILSVIGEHKLSEFAKKLEDAARREDILYILSNTGFFADRLEKLLEGLSTGIGTRAMQPRLETPPQPAE